MSSCIFPSETCTSLFAIYHTIDGPTPGSDSHQPNPRPEVDQVVQVCHRVLLRSQFGSHGPNDKGRKASSPLSLSDNGLSSHLWPPPHGSGRALLASAQWPFVVAFSVPRPSEHSSKHTSIPNLLGWLRDLVFQVQWEEGKKRDAERGKRGGEKYSIWHNTILLYSQKNITDLDTQTSADPPPSPPPFPLFTAEK